MCIIILIRLIFFFLESLQSVAWITSCSNIASNCLLFAWVLLSMRALTFPHKQKLHQNLYLAILSTGGCRICRLLFYRRIATCNAWGWDLDGWAVYNLGSKCSCELQHSTLALGQDWQSERPDPITWLVILSSSTCIIKSQLDSTDSFYEELIPNPFYFIGGKIFKFYFPKIWMGEMNLKKFFPWEKKMY